MKSDIDKRTVVLSKIAALIALIELPVTVQPRAGDLRSIA